MQTYCSARGGLAFTPAGEHRCGCPVDTSRRSREAPTEPAGENRPCELRIKYILCKSTGGREGYPYDLLCKNIAGGKRVVVPAKAQSKISGGIIRPFRKAAKNV